MARRGEDLGAPDQTTYGTDLIRFPMRHFRGVPLCARGNDEVAMTLPTTAHLPVAQSTVQPFLLRHTTEQIDNGQRRLSSRTVLVLTINLEE